MKSCPKCRAEQHFHYASNITSRENRSVENRNNWKRYFLWSPGCAHGQSFGVTLGTISEDEMQVIADRWDAHAEQLFSEYTARWTEPQRISYRARIWPPPPAPTELFDRYNHESPTITHDQTENTV